MEFIQWIRKEKKKAYLNSLLLEFLESHPFIYDMLSGVDDVWSSISIVLDMIPTSRNMKGDAFELYCHVIMAMNAFKKQTRAGELLITFLKTKLNIIKYEKHITQDDVMNLRIALETSKGVNDFLDKI